jgi:hypothetical protein
MKHLGQFIILLYLFISSCSPEKKEEPQKNIPLPGFKTPKVTDLSANKLLQSFLNHDFGKLRFVTMCNNNFVLITTDSITTETAYITDTNFTAAKKIYATAESKPIYVPFLNSIYSFPLFRNYCVDMFNPKDTLFIKGLPNNAEKINDAKYFDEQWGSRKPVKIAEGQYSFLYNYGLWGSKHKNYYDTTMFLYTDSNNNIKLFGKLTNPLIKKKYLAERQFIFDTEVNSFIYYASPLLDSIYKIDMNGNNLAAGKIASTHFTPYDEGRLSDIGYERQYMAKSTTNNRITVLDNYVVLLSLLAKKDIISPDQYAYTVYSKKLQPLYHDTIRHNIIPLVHNSGNSFYFFTVKLKELIKYEIH